MTATTQNSFLQRLWQYQAERFPLIQHGPLVAIFVLSGLMLSSLLRGQAQAPDVGVWLAATLSVVLLFFQLRVADEFKDAENDARYRPERPVPRGLVTLAELRHTAFAAAALQLILSWLVTPGLAVLLLIVWIYMALMTAEFFARDWLSCHLGTYMLSHMLVMPLIDFYITAFDWMPGAATPSAWLTIFLLISLFNGIILEIGRKSWAPEMEREGVESYSSTWGLKRATMAWAAAILLSACGIIALGAVVNLFWISFVFVGLLALLAALFAWHFSQQATVKNTKRLAALSGAWVFLSYFWLGPVCFWLSPR
jgi:4-hydroxybenzoate polyprenyltransferase